jgi:hypothetical protein
MRLGSKSVSLVPTRPCRTHDNETHIQELSLLSLSPAEVTYCFIVIVFAYALRGGTGFGAAIAMPLLALVVPMKILVPGWSVLSVVAGIDILRRDYDKIVWAELMPLMPSCRTHWDLPRQPHICRGERGEVQVASELDADSERLCAAREIDPAAVWASLIGHSV